MRKYKSNTRRIQRQRGGFTLIEMLVVIVIIGVLAGLGTWAAIAGIRTARQAAITYDLQQLSSALEQYKQANSDYPPDCTNKNLIARHIRTRSRRFLFPGIDATASPPVLGYFDTANLPQNQRLDPSEALVFWLALVNTSAQYPYPTDAGTAQNQIANGLTKVYFEFRSDQLVDLDGDGWPSYCAPFSDQTPYVYFHNDSYVTNPAQVYANPPTAAADLPGFAYPGHGVARPYISNFAPTQLAFVEPKKFQIISSGLDGHYGDYLPAPGNTAPKEYKLFPNGISATHDGSNYTAGTTGYRLEDDDNLTSFSGGKTLGDSRP